MLRATWGVSDAGGTVGGTSKVRYLVITPIAARARYTMHAHPMHMLDHARPPCNPTPAQAVLLEKPIKANPNPNPHPNPNPNPTPDQAVLLEKPIKEIKGALYAFAALLRDGTVQAWGWDG